MTEQEHSEDLQDLSAEIKRSEMKYQLMSQQLAQHVQDNTIMKGALNTAMIMVDQLLTDLRLAGGTPSKELIHAKLDFDVAMKRLFKEDTDDPPRA